MIKYFLIFIIFANSAASSIIAENLLGINQDMYSSSENTGGRFYFWSSGEYASGKYGFYPEGVDEDILFLHTGESPNKETVHKIHVENNIKKLHIFIGAQKIESVSLIDPAGIEMNPENSPDLNRSKYMLFGSIVNPKSGLWTLKLKSYGKRITQLAQAYKDSQLHIKLFTFLRFLPLLPHADYFPRRSVPLSGKTRACSIELSQHVSDISIEFESADGETKVSQGIFKELDGSKIYIGNCKVPEGSFRAVVKGKNQEGDLFQRTYSVLMLEGKTIFPFGIL